MPQPPRQLYLVGELPRAPAVAVVGTRHPTDEALRYTEELVGHFAKSGISIWSGGAEGVDAAAHRAALREGIPTVVVAPAGWLAPFPPKHIELFREVVERGGAYLSLVPPEREARRHLFFARNALMMALVGAVVIVQAGFRSGARNAAKFARKLGRPVFVVPSCPWVSQGLGCNLEITLGARVLMSPRDVVDAVSGCGLGVAAAFSPSHGQFRRGAEGDSPSPQIPPNSECPEPPNRDRSATCGVSCTGIDIELDAVLDAIRHGATNVDAICGRTGIRVPAVQSDILRLTLLGLVRTDPTGGVTPVSI